MHKSSLMVFAGGGSGGHLYPSLAVADALRSLEPATGFAFFGTDRAIDANVLSACDGRVLRQPVRPLPRRPWQVPTFLFAWRASTQMCRRLFRKQRPLAVLGNGGYASAPAICEAARLGIPTALLNPDAVPGKANRMLQSRVDAVFAQWPETAEHFNGQVAVHATGCPVRPEFKFATRQAGIEHFGLDPDKRVLLVTGASQGARSVNEALMAVVPVLADAGVWEKWQLLHLTGPSGQDGAEALYRRCGVSARVVGFTKHMASALAAADLVLSRAGASTLAEITALGRPAVLMPYPHHGDRHQVANARMLVKAGAARLVTDRVDPQQNAGPLSEVLLHLMRQEEELSRLASAARRIGTSNAAGEIARHLLRMGRQARPAEPIESMEETCAAGR